MGSEVIFKYLNYTDILRASVITGYTEAVIQLEAKVQQRLLIEQLPRVYPEVLACSIPSLY